jgi:hypothetical protein
MQNVICGHGNIDVVSSDPDITEKQEYLLSHPLRMLAYNLHSMQGGLSDESAVYVISDIFGKSVKIGEARDVNKRLMQLRPGNPRRLYIHRAFWFRNKQYAQFVECQAHHVAPDRGYERLQSEWFACTPKQAHDVILDTIKFLRVSSFGIATPGVSHWFQEEAA